MAGGGWVVDSQGGWRRVEGGRWKWIMDGDGGW